MEKPGPGVSFIDTLMYNYYRESAKIHSKSCFEIQCPPLNRITLGQNKCDNNNRMIQLTDVFCVLLRYRWAINF
jgi:hypothetical protein